MNSKCEKLEPFLSGDLRDDDALRFEAHVHECEACRDAIGQQHWIDGLLRSHTRIELEPAPEGVSKTVCVSMMRRRYARLAACGLVAAAVLFVLAGWIFMLNRQARDAAEPVIARAFNAETEPSPDPSLTGRGLAEPLRAVFVGGPDLFVAAVESRNPNVTIVRLYPTYKPTLASDASVESSDADPFNGG